MCLLCVEHMLEGLTIREIKSAGTELMSTAKNIDEVEHIIDRLKELEDQHEES